MEQDWMTRPRIIEYWPEGVEYVMGMDESGTADLLTIARKIEAGREDEIDFTMRDFTLTGIVLDMSGYDVLKSEVNGVKFAYWENGLADYKGTVKRVCFHSREIRKNSHPFNAVNRSEFTDSISNMMENVNAKIISCHVDKLAHFKKYTTPVHPYHLAAEFILERYCKRLNDIGQKGLVILESRGKKEDKFVLDYLVYLIQHGNRYHNPSFFQSIAGVYFNPKWCETSQGQTSYVILEYADLACFPIHKQFRGGDLSQGNPAYDIVEKKFFRYPNHNGWGLKLWRP